MAPRECLFQSRSFGPYSSLGPSSHSTGQLGGRSASFVPQPPSSSPTQNSSIPPFKKKSCVIQFLVYCFPSNMARWIYFLFPSGSNPFTLITAHFPFSLALILTSGKKGVVSRYTSCPATGKKP